MGVFENLPYTNFHELNLDWIVQKMKELIGKTDQIDQAVTDAEAAANDAQSAANEAQAAASVVRTKDWTSDLELNSEYVELHQYSHVYQQGNIVTGCLALAAVSAFGQVGNVIIIEGLPKAVNNIYLYGISDQCEVVDFFINTDGQLKTAGYGSVSANDVLFMNVNYLAESLMEV